MIKLVTGTFGHTFLFMAYSDSVVILISRGLCQVTLLRQDKQCHFTIVIPLMLDLSVVDFSDDETKNAMRAQGD